MTGLIALAGSCGTASAQCGEATHRPPRGDSLDGQPAPLAIGDSVLYDAAGALAGRGFEVNAMVCRQMSQGIALLRARGRGLPHLVVLALGTNGAVSEGDIDTVLDLLGPQRVLAMVTPHHGVVGSDSDVIRTAAKRHRGRIIVLDWDRLSAGHGDWFAPDGIHLGGSVGIAAYVGLVAGTLPFAVVPCPP